MGLAQMQAAMARLYTDAPLRERFFADPPASASGEALGLSCDETRQLAQLSPRQVAYFARSLHNKRFGEASKLLPLTHRLLGPRFAELFRRHANAQVPEGVKKHQDDALAFAAFIEQVALTDGLAQWIAEVARYEAAWLKVSGRTCRCTVCLFRYPISFLARALTQVDPATAPLAQPTIALWFRLSRRGRIRHLALSVPFRWFRRSSDASNPTAIRERRNQNNVIPCARGVGEKKK